MIAILFWFTILVIAVMSIAHGKWFETNIFEALGAIGQVFFAGAVFWLGWQQFEFTKRTAAQQHRVDTFTIRKEILDRFLTMFDVTEKRANSGLPFGDDLIDEWLALESDVTQVFSDAAGTEILEIMRRLSRCDDGSAWRQELQQRHGDDIDAQSVELRENWDAISTHRFTAWHLMHQELTISGSHH